MRLRHVAMGVLAYLAGAAVILIVTLVATGGRGLLSVMSGADLAALIVGCLVVAIAALVLKRLGYDRPSAATRREGARPAAERKLLGSEGLSWGSLALVAGAGMGFAVTPPVAAEEAATEPARGTFQDLVIDGDRDGVLVRFEHHHAPEVLRGRSCARCHHLNQPGEEATPCSDCHRSMTGETDIFDHGYHSRMLGGNDGCQGCHPDPDVGRVRSEVRPCTDCHDTSAEDPMHVMVAEGSTIPMGDGIAPSYVDAMHGVCVGCHREVQERAAHVDEDLTRCLACHPRGGVGESR